MASRVPALTSASAAAESLRRLFFNTVLVNGLIMAAQPLLSVLMLAHLRFPVWQYGLVFAVPCIGGLIGSRLARRVVSRCGERAVLRVFGTLRACWPIGLAFVQPGVAGLVIVMATEFGLIVCASIFNPVFAAYRLHHTDSDRHARVLLAWSITTSASIAVVTVSWGLLAQLLGTPLLLPRRATAELVDTRGAAV